MAGPSRRPDRRTLTAGERAAWEAVARTVRRTGAGNVLAEVPAPPAKALKSDSFLMISAAQRPSARPSVHPVAVLDRGWEKRIRGGTLAPERSVDLHGHNLASAHRLFNLALAQAARDDVRILLVVTGKARESVSAPGTRRGAIALEIGHWIETSPLADRIASVRRAHPRHGGAGALYLILRRRKAA